MILRKSSILVIIIFTLLAAFLAACSGKNQKQYVVGFVDIVEDETLAQARKGFFKALNDSGFVKDKNIEIIYRNAQNDLPTLIQSIDYMIAQNVNVIATNTTLCTISAVQRTSQIPVCMMVSPSPEIAGLLNAEKKAPQNLFGVYETLEYIDTAFALIHEIFPKAKRIGTIINQSEPQSLEALKRINRNASSLGLEVVSLPANSSAETQLVTESLIEKQIDVFFALPDNTIFASFETIAAACDKAKVPIVTSESGLVSRGALIAFGADIYQWGYDAGIDCAAFLKSGKLPAAHKLLKRTKLYNDKKASIFHLAFDSTYTKL
jgi:putative tryptophan/tyrosine transport system substrate-binding protein